MNASKTIVTATLDGAALAVAPCGVCRELLSPLAAAYQIDLATDGHTEFLLFTPRLSGDQLATLRPHRDCLLATVITLTTPQFFLIERRQPDGSWRPCDLRMLSFLAAAQAWTALVEEIKRNALERDRATWLAAGISRAHYPG